MREINVLIERNESNVAVVSSRTIAEQLGKEHSKVLKRLDSLLLENPELACHITLQDYSVEGQSRTYKEYVLTKKGFTLYMFNITGHNDFKYEKRNPIGFRQWVKE